MSVHYYLCVAYRMTTRNKYKIIISHESKKNCLRMYHVKVHNDLCVEEERKHRTGKEVQAYH